MKRVAAAVLAAMALCWVVFVWAKPHRATAPAVSRETATEAPAESPPTVDDVPVPEPKPDTSKLEAYLLEAMTKWAPASTMPGRDVAHFPAIAHDVAEVVLDPLEKALWEPDPGKGKTATLLAAMAFWEGRFWKHVDDGTCNDMAKRRQKKVRELLFTTGDCDGGIAYSLWQLHAYGVVLTDDGEWKYSWDAPGKKSLTGADIIADRKLAARLALHMIRKSFRLSGHTLCGYSGEPGPCPKAKMRLQFAENWSARHPFKE